ncbi:MAG: OmpA family protein [Syntrophaceae bacterium]|nr:OmpA family protein [Syntrophaceae bacterium]
MKRNVWMIGSLAIICSFMFIFAAGCAKAPVVKEEVALQEGESVIATAETAPAKVEEVVAAPKEEAKKVVEDQGMTEKALWEALLAEATMYKDRDIYFAFDRYDLNQESRQNLGRLANWILIHEEFEVTIEGHCDERGTTEYNLALGERRAEAAKAYIINLGVDIGKVATISYGEELPLDPGHNEGAWSKNRRGHFLVYPSKK